MRTLALTVYFGPVILCVPFCMHVRLYMGSQLYLLSLLDCFMLYSTAIECEGSQYR